NKPAALALLASERPRNVGWLQAAGLLFGDWGTSRLYVLGLALFFAGRSSFWLILLMSLLILAVGWAYTQICRIYPDGGGVYTAAKSRSRTLAVIGALLLFADYTVTASLSSLDAFHYFGLGHTEAVQEERAPTEVKAARVADAKYDRAPTVDAGERLYPHRESPSSAKESLFSLAIVPLNRDAHLADMLAFLTGHYVGGWGEWAVRIIGGTLLLSATHTALTDMISVQYLMARDGELPQWMTALNRFGVPWIPA